MSDHNLHKIENLDCDVLVIGSGAGGASVGYELVNAGYDVLMLEEGASVPFENAPETLSKSFNKMWRAGGLTLANGSSPIAYAEGSCVGGSTEINSAIFQRTPEELLEKWASKYSIENFSAGNLLPFYDQAARLVNASFTDGNLGLHSEILRKAGELKNWGVMPLERGQKKCVGTNHCSIGCPTGAKQSMSTSVLRQYTDNGGRLISRCRVERLIKSKTSVKSARARVKNKEGIYQTIKITAKYFFVCGGATQTPNLLLKSGFKAPVGNGFKLHPTIRILAEFDEKINAQRSRLPLYAITEFLPNFRIGGSIASLPTFGMFLAEDWEFRSHMMPSFSNMGMYYAMARGTGVGKIKSIPYSKHPYVSFQLSEEDWENLEVGLQSLAICLFESGAKKIQPSIAGMDAWDSIDAMYSALSGGLPRKMCNLMTIHIFSSIGMGENPKISAANSYGKIWGSDNLYVADASLIPEAPSVNPQASVMALALRVAKNFIEKMENN